MLKFKLWAACCVAVIAAGFVAATPSVEAAPPGQPSNWQRFYYYPYVYYPQNFQKPVEYDHMYYRYPVERRIPVYNQHWNNFYPNPHPYHWGNHFAMDVF